ncbi:MAG TPA: excalibur calcium-binding domain-containing protein [Mycobacterium sp.]|nr:excalibur calcium-binding domain-containing protein [Mycobacterium sp.]
MPPDSVQPTTPVYTPNSIRPPAAPPTTAVGASVYYPDCAAARRAGAAPLYAGQPGYRPGLDRDGDGIACES